MHPDEEGGDWEVREKEGIRGRRGPAIIAGSIKAVCAQCAMAEGWGGASFQTLACPKLIVFDSENLGGKESPKTIKKNQEQEIGA